MPVNICNFIENECEEMYFFPNNDACREHIKEVDLR